MANPYLVQRLDKLKARLNCQRATGMTWRAIAAQFPGVPPGTLCAIAKGRKPPAAHLKALGLVGCEPWVAGPVKWLRGKERERLTR